MEPRFRIISYTLCPFAQRALIVLLEKGIEHECTYIDLADKPAWFLKLAPTGKVPVLEDRVSGPLFESLAICDYLDELSPGSLQPKDKYQTYLHKAWVSYATSLFGQIWGLCTAAKQADFDRHQQDIRQSLLLLEKQIKGPFFAGDDFHMVDAMFAPAFRYYQLFDQLDDLQIPLTPRVQIWRESMFARKGVADAAVPTFVEELKASILAKNSYMARFVKGIGRKKGLLWS